MHHRDERVLQLMADKVREGQGGTHFFFCTPPNLQHSRHLPLCLTSSPSVSVQVVIKIDEFKPQELSNVMWAFAR